MRAAVPDRLSDLLTRLKLTAVRDQLDGLLDEAGRQELSLRETLVLLCEREIARKDERRIEMTLKLARFPFVRDLSGFDFLAQPSLDPKQIRELASAPAGSAMARTCCCLGRPSPLHDAHLSMSLKFKSFLQGIAGRRTSQTTGCRRAFHVASVQVGGADDPGRSLTELIRRELTIFDQTAHGRRTNG